MKPVLRHRDFRWLLLLRLVSQSADGFIQAALVASLAFSPESQATAAGFAIATAITALPYSLIGPFVGVFIDRWSRRAILVRAPLLRVLPAFLLLLNPHRYAALFYLGALWITAVNRFFLATAQAVVPRLVPTEDLLTANSLATVGGTVALLAGVFAGGLIADVVGVVPIVAASTVMWAVASLIATRIRRDLRPRVLPDEQAIAEAPGLAAQLREAGVGCIEGIRHLVAAPRAAGPIASIAVDQAGQALVLVLAIIVFRERFGGGVGSFSWLIGAGGVGVFVGLGTVGILDRVLTRDRIIALSFAVGAVALFSITAVVSRWTVLVGAFVLGLTFAWKKIPADTLVQEAVPDGIRGRVFAVYDVTSNLARLLAAVLAIPLLPLVGVRGATATVGVVFLIWVPVLPWWISRSPQIELEFGDDLLPARVTWAGVTEAVQVVSSGTGARPSFRLALDDGTVLDVSQDAAAASGRALGTGRWRIDREGPAQTTRPG
jgi:MFS family permease